MKVCTKCKLEKEFSEFYKRENSKDGYRNECKDCYKKNSKEYSKEYHSKNRDIRLKNQKIYYLNNKEKILEKTILYYYNNREKMLKCSKKYKELNKKKIKEKRIANRDRYNKYQIDFRNLNPFNKIKQKIRNIISKSLTRKGFSKNSRTEEILGCTFEEFKIYLESKFEIWMNWDNRGLYNGELEFGWDIDHIIPLSSAETEEDLIKLSHYLNLQPLCSYINRVVKKDKIEFNE